MKFLVVMKQIIVTPGGPEVREENYKLGSLDRRVGFVEKWYSGGSEGFDGVRADDKWLKLGGFLLGWGTPMEVDLTHGIIHQDMMYDNRTALVCGAVSTYAKRREFWRESSNFSLCYSRRPPAKVGDAMPSRIMTIFAEESERVFDAAAKLRIVR